MTQPRDCGAVQLPVCLCVPRGVLVRAWTVSVASPPVDVTDRPTLSHLSRPLGLGLGLGLGLHLILSAARPPGLAQQRKLGLELGLGLQLILSAARPPGLVLALT